MFEWEVEQPLEIEPKKKTIPYIPYCNSHQ